MKNKIKIGVSSCLLGEKVRWNGDHKQDRYARDVLGNYFEYVPTCPEVDVGMGIPRETVIRDCVKYRLPFGIPGDFLAGQWVKKNIEDIFHFRKNKIEEFLRIKCWILDRNLPG